MNKKKVKEPAYYTSATNMQTTNYKVYYMGFFEAIAVFLVGFVVGAAVGYLFYGGIGRDEFGRPTQITNILNIVIPSIVGVVAGKLFFSVRVKSVIARRKKELASQFRDMLEAFTTSLGAGKNVNDSFFAVYDDLKIQYEEGSYILKELEVIISGIHNNVPIENVLEDFGIRSDNEDILNFANVFKISYRKGGNVKDIIRNTHSILSDKMEIAEDIETIVSSNKLEQNIVSVMPILIVGIIKVMSPDFAANFVTLTGIMSTTISIVIFVAAYFIGRAILNIKI